MKAPQSLARLLRRGHWRSAIAALAVVGLILGAVSLLVLRNEVGRSLEGVARSAAFSAEAAVMFEDVEAAEELLRTLAAQEHLASIEIVLPDGRVLARVQRRTGWLGGAADRLAARVFDLEAHGSIRKNDRLRGEVRVRGDSEDLVSLLSGYALGVLAAMAVTAVLVVASTRRLERRITQPLQTLAQFTRSVREHRDFERRASPSGLAEVDALADDFNALLAEMQAHEAELLERQARLRSRNEALRQQAEADALTGLPNRAAFTVRLQQAVERAAERGKALGLMFVDADRFKDINDSFGHAVGDRVLIEIGQRLQRSLRDSDLVARLGGDEFAILLEPLADAADAELVARKIEAQMHAPLHHEGLPPIVPRVSIGLALYPGDGADAQALLAHADRLMYERKRGRRDAPVPPA